MHFEILSLMIKVKQFPCILCSWDKELPADRQVRQLRNFFILSLLTSILHWTRIATKDNWTLGNISVRISNLIFSVPLIKPQPVAFTRSGVLTATLLRLKSPGIYFNHFNTCTLRLLLFCTMTNKCTIISQIITLLHVSTLSCHTQVACNQCLFNFHRYFRWSCW